MRAIWIGVVGAVAALAAVSASAAPAHRATAGGRSAAAEPVFYDISEDPSALKLLALSASGRQGAYTLIDAIDAIDVMRQPKMMFTNTWRIDCGAERMAVVHTVRVEPGQPVQEADVTPAPTSTRANPVAFRIAGLACSGRGDLVQRRTYHGELFDIAKRFWAQ